MRFHYIILVILLIASTTLAQKSFSQNSWKWSRLHGPNTGDASHKLLFGPHHEIIAQDFLGYYSTPDYGKTWSYKTVVTGYKKPIGYIDDWYFPFSQMKISSSGIYYFIFAHQDKDSANDWIEGIYRSTDFGETWNHIAKINSIYQFLIGDDNSIIAVTNPTPGYLKSGLVYESIDNGLSWTNIFSFSNTNEDQPFVIGENKNGIYFSTGSSSDIRIKKFDFQAQQFMPFSNGIPRISQLYFGTLTNGTLFAFTDSIIFTSDGLSSWDSIGANYNLTSPKMGNGDTIVAQGYNRNGRYYLTMSTNGGHKWDSIGRFIGPNPLNAGYTFNYENPNELLFETYDAIFVSTDRGGNWGEIGLPYAKVDNVFVSGEKIFTRSFFNLPWDRFSFCRSEDRGEHWQKMDSFNLVQIGKGIGGNVIAIAPDTTVGHYNSWILDTFSLHWTQRSHTGDISYASFTLNHTLVTSNTKKYLYVSANDKAYRSDDSGITWVQLIPSYIFDDIFSIDFNADSIVYLAASPPLFRSDDYGKSWNLLNGIFDPVKLHCVKTFDQFGVLLGTDGGGLLQSLDKGETWARIDKNNFDTVTSIGIDSKGNIAAGTNHGLWLFDNLNRNWLKIIFDKDTNFYIGSIDVSKDDDFFVGVYGSSVWVGTSHYNSVTSSNITSKIKLFPNPANGAIHIELQTTEFGRTQLAIVNLLGLRIVTVYDGELMPGSHFFDFNTKNLSSGAYFLLLQTPGGQSRSRIDVEK